MTPLSIRRGKARAADLLDALEIGDTWDAHDAERAFNSERRWAALLAKAPRGGGAVSCWTWDGR